MLCFEKILDELVRIFRKFCKGLTHCMELETSKNNDGIYVMQRKINRYRKEFNFIIQKNFI